MKVVEFNKKYEDKNDGLVYVYRKVVNEVVEDCYADEELFDSVKVTKKVYMMNDVKCVLTSVVVGEIAEYSGTQEERCSLPLLKEAEKRFFSELIK